MSAQSNPGKTLARSAGGVTYHRLAVKTRFIRIGDDLLRILREDVAPHAQPGDILAISEKVVALSQRRIVRKEDIRPGFWAGLLCRFVHVTPAGPGAGTPHKMQLIIDICSLPRVLFAALCAALGRLAGKKGVFYRVCGHDVGAIDGLVRDNISFPEYGDYAILAPDQPCRVCDSIEQALGLPAAIVDACDLSVSILGRSRGLPPSDAELCEALADNPAGQGDQQTPVILLRRYAQDRDGTP